MNSTILGLIKSPNILVLNSDPFHPKEVFIKAVTYQPARVVDRSQLLQTSLPHPPLLTPEDIWFKCDLPQQLRPSINFGKFALI